MVGTALLVLGASQRVPDPVELTLLARDLYRGVPYERVKKGVDDLIRRGADPNARWAEALSLFAARDSKGDIVQALIKAGANPNIGSSSGALLDLENRLKPLSGWMFPLHAAVGGRMPASVAVLVKAGARINGYGDPLYHDRGYSGTPLGVCAALALPDPQDKPLTPKLAEEKDVEIARILLKAGANVHWVRPLDKGTPLHFAASEGKPKLAALLIKNGADKSRRDNSKRTPYDLARISHPKNKELLRVLDFPRRKPGLPRTKPIPHDP
jgi:ankyrin repeat protein